MIRPPIFATGLTIRNFRGYGTFNLDLPAEPCVVLLSGPNGLGKTSLFEAIEWALTDSVKRLDMLSGGTADPHDLVRRAPNVDSFQVGLSFQDTEGREERISRTQVVPTKGSSPTLGTNLDSVAQLLGSDEARWKVTGENLSAYLHLTHLHAQAASLRLVTFKSKERWLRVSPLAGAERFDRVRMGLTNTKQALTKLRERRSEELKFARARQSQFIDLTLRLAQVQSIAEASGEVLSPRDVVRMAVDRINRLGGDPARSISTTDDVIGASEALSALRSSAERVLMALSTRANDLARLRQVVRHASELTAQREKLQSQISTLETEGSERRKRVDLLTAQLHVDRQLQLTRQGEREAASSQHDRLVQALVFRNELPKLEADVAESRGAIGAQSLALEVAEVELRHQRDELTALEAIQTQRERNRESLRDADAALDALSQIDAFSKQLAIEEVQLAGLNAAATIHAASSQTVASEIATANEDLLRAEQELANLHARAGDVRSALAVVAEHLAETDTDCPVCATTFPLGELRLLARAAVTAFEPKLTETEALVSKLRESRIELDARATSIAREQRKVAADIRPVSEKIGQLSDRIKALTGLPLVGGRSLEDARLAVGALREYLNAEVARLDRDAKLTKTSDAVRNAITDAIARVDSTRRQAALERERHNVRSARLSEVHGRLAQLATELQRTEAKESELQQFIEDAARALSLARSANEQATAKYAETHAAESAARRGLEALREEFQKVRTQRLQADTTWTALETEWQNFRLSLPISDATLDAAEQRDAVQRGEVDSAAQLATSLSASLKRWQDAADLQRIEDDLRREQGPRTREEHSAELEAIVVRANEEFAHADRARLAADELGKRLVDVTTEFGERSVKPFGDLFQRYLRALVHDERFHKIGAVYEPAARGAGLNFRVNFGGSQTQAEHILSEGQLGEVSLAAMLAASTAFPWSRWRALLLDDPTQYNDLIHATALFDVLRNLVRFAKHQIFISTHDNEQASFFRRKLDAINISWVDLRFRAQTSEGIETDVSRGGKRSAA